MVRTSLRRLLASPALEGFVRIAVVLSLAGSATAWLQTRDLAQCVARYNDANNQRSVVLTEATNAERAAERATDDAQAALFLSPLVSKPARERTTAEQAEILRLFRAYQVALTDQREERRAADDARRVNPIPDPPKAVCD